MLTGILFREPRRSVLLPAGGDLGERGVPWSEAVAASEFRFNFGRRSQAAGNPERETPVLASRRSSRTRQLSWFLQHARAGAGVHSAVIEIHV